MRSPEYLKARVLFTIIGCPHCREYARFIESFNLKLPLEKKIKVVDCTNYYDFGIMEDPIFKAFKHEISKTNTFPILFFEGGVLHSSGISKEQAENFIKALVKDEFLNDEEHPYYYDKVCQVQKFGLFGRERVVCSDDG